MKIFTIVLLLLAGCAAQNTGQNNNCEKYAAAYKLYQASLQYREPSKDELTAASAAASFLMLYCGWSNDPAGRELPYDSYGIPVIHPPK